MTFKVEGMTCNHCKANVEKAILGVEGVTGVTIDLNSGKAEVEGTPDPKAVIAAVESRGYDCSLS